MVTVPFKGPQKVAALLLTLDPDMASSLLSQFDEPDIMEVGTAMATIDPAILNEEMVGALHKEFVDSMVADTGDEVGEGGIPPVDVALDQLLGMTLSADKAKQMKNKIESNSRKSRPFFNLEVLKLDTLKKVLAGEHPQILALVCSKMAPETTAVVLGGMADEERNDVVQRMATIENIRPDYLKEIVAALEAKAASFKPAVSDAAAATGEVVEEEVDPVKRLKSVVEILKTVEVEVEKSIIKGLEEKDPEMVKQIKELMFTFDDLGTLDKKAMQKVLMGFDVRVIALALKAADPIIESNFINNMSKRVQGLLAEERETLEGVTVDEITGAQKEIMATVRTMIDSGEIQIPRKGGNAAKPK